MTAAHPPLIAVAHGSRDPRSAATVRSLIAETRSQAPWLDIQSAFLELSSPHLDDVLADVRSSGHDSAVIVPLLLGRAYHATTDLPALVNNAKSAQGLDVSVSDVLGVDPILEAVAIDNLTEAGVDLTAPQLGIVLAAVGSSRPSANAAVTRLAAEWSARMSCTVTPAFASATPDMRSGIARLRALGASRFAVAPWFLAPGLLLDQVNAIASYSAPAVMIARPLGPDPRIARSILRRYAEARIGETCAA